MTPFEGLCKELEGKIQAAYTEGVSLEDAEKLASEFLYAMLQVSSELKDSDLNARMRKSGLKAVKAALYLDVASKGEGGKKPTEANIAAMIDSADVVQGEQDAFDKAEVGTAELERYYQVFKEAHIHFRGVAKGKFGE